MSQQVKAELWNKHDRRRIRELHKAGTPLNPDERDVYELDKQRRRAKRERKLNASEAADDDQSYIDATATDLSLVRVTNPAEDTQKASSSNTGAPVEMEEIRPSTTTSVTLTPPPRPEPRFESAPVHPTNFSSAPPQVTIETVPDVPSNPPTPQMLTPRGKNEKRSTLTPSYDDDDDDHSENLTYSEAVQQQDKRDSKYDPHYSVAMSPHINGDSSDEDRDEFGVIGNDDAAEEKRRAQMNPCMLCCYDFKKRIRLQAMRRRDPIPLWRGSLKEIDGRFGSSIVSWFNFSRWIFLWNLVMFMIWALLVEIPYTVNFNWRSITNIGWEIILGIGLEGSPFFYGGYPSEVAWYRLDLAYACVLPAVFVITLLELIRNVQKARGGQSMSLVRKDHKLPFSTLLFNAWDFTLTDPEAAKILRHGITNHLRETLEETGGVNLRRQKMGVPRMVCMWFLRVVSLAITLGLIVTGIIIISYVVGYSATLEAYFALLPTILIAAVNAGFPVIITIVSIMEQWESARTTMYLNIIRIYILKMANIIYLMISYYYQTQNASCPENLVGQQFWKLVLIDIAVCNGAAIFGDGAKYLMGRCRKTAEESRIEFDLVGSVIELIYRQAIVWIGMIWCPFLPFWGMLATMIGFYVKKWMLFAVCRPPEKAWDASKSGNFFYGCLIVTLLLCIIPLTYFFARAHSLTDCGPHAAYAGGAQAVFGQFVSYAPGALASALYWIFNPIVLVGIIFFMCIVIYFVRGSVTVYRDRLQDTQGELLFEQRERIRMMKEANSRRDRRRHRRTVAAAGQPSPNASRPSTPVNTNLAAPNAHWDPESRKNSVISTMHWDPESRKNSVISTAFVRPPTSTLQRPLGILQPPTQQGLTPIHARSSAYGQSAPVHPPAHPTVNPLLQPHSHHRPDTFGGLSSVHATHHHQGSVNIPPLPIKKTH